LGLRRGTSRGTAWRIIPARCVPSLLWLVPSVQLVRTVNEAVLMVRRGPRIAFARSRLHCRIWAICMSRLRRCVAPLARRQRRRSALGDRAHAGPQPHEKQIKTAHTSCGRIQRTVGLLAPDVQIAGVAMPPSGVTGTICSAEYRPVSIRSGRRHFELT
jgi:hypothetical protein